MTPGEAGHTAVQRGVHRIVHGSDETAVGVDAARRHDQNPITTIAEIGVLEAFLPLRNNRLELGGDTVQCTFQARC